MNLHALLDDCGVLARLRAAGKLVGKGGGTIKGVHEGVAGDGGTGATGSGGEGVVEPRLVAAHQVLDCLVGREVNRMCRS